MLLAIGIFSLRYSVRVGHWLDNALFSWIAKISYGVYLWQAIFIVTLQRFLFPGYEQLPMQQWIILVTLSLACSFGAGWLSYTYLEVGVTKWRKKWMK